ncbi:MAG: hypothetical protein ACYTF0_01895 [Planctomycetota bacterium]|jgi:hypothetical protein
MSAWLATPEAQTQLNSEQLTPLNNMLESAGLPAYGDCLAGVTGPILLYARSSAPFPSLTLAVGISDDLGQAILMSLEQRGSFTSNAAGVLQRQLGVMMISAAHVDGELILTSHANGIAAHRQRQGGFSDHPDVQAALSAIPTDRPINMAGVSRSALWWSTLANFASIPAIQAGIPGAATIARDVRAAFSHGYLWGSYDAAGHCTFELAGPIGGFASLSMGAALAVPAINQARSAARRAQRKARREAEGESEAPAVF